jgi:predicted peptidase
MNITTLPTEPGIYEGILQPRDRRFTISIPDGYAGKNTTPLILALHWGGTVVNYIGKSLLVGLIGPALDELDAIIVAPDRTTDNWANSQSEADLIEMLQFVTEYYSIDQAQTLITGYSIGGIGAWYMGTRHQDLFTAVLPISARPCPAAVETEWKIPIYVIHSKNDQVFPLDEVRDTVNKLKLDDVNIQLKILEWATHYDTSGYITPLNKAIPWIRRVWKMD